MPRNPVTAPMLRAGYLRHDLVASLRDGNPRVFARALASFAVPSRWPAPRATREAVQDAGIERHSLAAARAAEADLAAVPAARRPGTRPALRRARALELIATTLPPDQSAVERTVAAFLRGELAPPRAGAADPDPSSSAEAARHGADEARRTGHPRPIVVATFPGFDPNPYGALMETVYGAHGRGERRYWVAERGDAIVGVAAAGGDRVVVHLNAPDRFVGPVAGEAEAAHLVAATEDRLDRWREQGATLVASIHNGPRLTGARGTAERLVAQAIVDRAAVVHVLTASTPARLAGWISIDPDRVVHVAHPSYDGALAPLPPRAAAPGRRAGPPARRRTVPSPGR